jgi:hypothetical protein
MVKLTIFLFKGLSESLLSNNLAFRIISTFINPIPINICAAILDVKLGYTCAELFLNSIERQITKYKFPIPVPLSFDFPSLLESEKSPIANGDNSYPMQNQAHLYYIVQELLNQLT